MIFNRIIQFMVSMILAHSWLCSQELEIYPYKTQSGKQIEYMDAYIGSRQNKPIYFSVGGQIIFSTAKDETGEYEPIVIAGNPTSHRPYQIITIGKDKFCNRLIMAVGRPAKRRQYVFDFSQAKPIIVGPFQVADDWDEVQAVYWGKTYALIKFKSFRQFKYYYKNKTVVED